MTPATWKRDRVRARLNAGDDLETAITRMQRQYIQQVKTGEPFVDYVT